MKTLSEIAQNTHDANPQWLTENRVSTVFKFTQALVKNLKKAGYKVSYVGKTKGEGQYTPPNWAHPTVNGFVLSGVSHDALWVNGIQYDFVGRGNDSEEEIFYPDGRHMDAAPTANEIPSKYWRPNNPPVDIDGPEVVQTFEPTKTVHVKAYPGDPVGLNCAVQLFKDYAQKGEAPNPGMGVWLFRVAWQVAQEGKSPEESVNIQRNGPQGWKLALGI